MDQKANPIHQHGDRNIFCPYYNNCLDYAVKLSWKYWDCSLCSHKLMQSITECEYEVNDAGPYYDLPLSIAQKIAEDSFD
jgi:hypothetical protein